LAEPTRNTTVSAGITWSCTSTSHRVVRASSCDDVS
jgi:hypothetical protein